MGARGEKLRGENPRHGDPPREGVLQRLKVPGDHIDRLLENRAYTPADLLIMARALSKLNAANTGDFVAKAAAARSRDVAFFQRTRAEFLARRSAELGGIAAFINAGGVPLNRTRDGNVVAAFPFDELAWTEIVQRAAIGVTAKLKKSRQRQKSILAVSGLISPLASREFETLGWRVVQLP